MMNNLPIWLPRVVGVLAAWLVGWAARHELTLDADQVTAIMIAGYSLVHRYVSAHTNPGDAAKRELVPADKSKVAQVKASES